MKLEDLEIYQLAMEIGDEIWFSVVEWENLEKYSIGQQIIRSADSIAANISEGFGRFHFKDRKNFVFYARGSQSETKTWLTKSKNRSIISEEFYTQEMQKLEKLGVKLNNYLKVLEKHRNKLPLITMNYNKLLCVK